MIRRLLLLIIAGLAGVPGPGRTESVLRVGTLTELEPLSPVATSAFWYGAAWTGLVHQPLLTTGADGELAPCLARRWEVAADNRSLTFHLQPGARWHDGEPLTAHDVAFTLDLYREHQLIGQLWRFYAGSEVVDDSTVVVRFRDPVAYYQSLNFAVPPVLPRHVWTAVGEPRHFSGAAAMVGSGVFAFHAWDVDARVAYLRRRAPAGTESTPAAPAPPVDRVEVRFFASPGALVLALRRGEIDLVMGSPQHVPPAYVDALSDDDEVRTLELPAAGVPLSLVFHGRRWPTALPAFRRAVVLAVEPEAFVRTVLRGRGRQPELGFVPPALWTYAGPFPALRPAARRAAGLLDSLGFRDLDGDGLREDPRGEPFVLPLIPETWQSAGEAERAAELLVHQLRQVGLAAAVDKHVVDREYALLWDERDYLAYVGHTTPTATRDGGHVYFANYADFSYGTFTDSSYLARLDRITGAPDKAAYLRAVAAAQAWNAEHLPGVALAWGTRTYAWRADRFTGWGAVAGLGLPAWESWHTVRVADPADPADPAVAGGAPAGVAARGESGASWLWLLAAGAAAALLVIVLRRRRRGG